MVETFTNIITNAANKSIGSHKKQNNKPKVPRWNDEIKKIIKKKEALNTLKKNKTLHNFTQQKTKSPIKIFN